MTMALELKPDQVGILVFDIEAAIPRYSALFGVNEWRLWTYGPGFVPNLSYRGQPGKFVMRLAFSDTTPQLELIESVHGPSIYEEWLTDRRVGLHHIGTFVPSLADAVDGMRQSGYEPIQTGRGYGADGDGGFAYYDTVAELGIITEVVEVPATRRPPEATWHAGRWHRELGAAEPPAAGVVNE